MSLWHITGCPLSHLPRASSLMPWLWMLSHPGNTYEHRPVAELFKVPPPKCHTHQACAHPHGHILMYRREDSGNSFLLFSYLRELQQANQRTDSRLCGLSEAYGPGFCFTSLLTLHPASRPQNSESATTASSRHAAPQLFCRTSRLRTVSNCH